MTTPNRTLLQKADMDLAQITADGGLLATQQADEFIQLAIKQAVLLKDANVTPMKGPVEERDKMRFSGRVLKPGAEATALPVMERSRPALSRITLTAQLFKAEVRYSDEVVEDQVERGTFKDTIMTSLAGAVARDMEAVAIQGDVASADPLLAVLDGFIVQATANTVNAGGARLAKATLRDMLKALDDEFTATDKLKFYTNRQARVDYRDSLADRATPLGDLALVTGGEAKFQDIPVIAVPEFPVAAGNTHVLLTDPQNLMVGIWRNIRFELARDVPAGVFIIVGTLRFDVRIVEVNALARAFNVVGT